jgi:hypothetical protein
MTNPEIPDRSATGKNKVTKPTLANKLPRFCGQIRQMGRFLDG